MTAVRSFVLTGLVVALLNHAPAMAADAEAQAQPQPSAPPDSIMFTIDELNEIQSRVGTGGGDGRADRERPAIEDASLYLSTILYYGPTDWTIWINGVPIVPRQEFGSFEVTGIGPDHVELLVPLSAQGMKPVRLAPNQTFISKSGSIVEGKWTN